MAASRSRMGFAMERVKELEYSDKYKAVSRQGGTANRTPTLVTQKVPVI